MHAASTDLPDSDGIGARSGDGRAAGAATVRLHLVDSMRHAPAEESVALPICTRPARAAKRIMDVAIAAIALVIAFPLIYVVATVVACSFGGPIFFRQQRVGKDGQSFTMLKFRTMRVGTHELTRSDPQLWAEFVANDYKLADGHPQTTRIGYWLRRLSIDELPQLLNVLLGQMAIVGIRPVERPQFDERCPRSRDLYCLVRPGLTGLWQVEGRRRQSIEARTDLDDRYVTDWSIGLDLSLISRTPLAVVRPDRSGIGAV